MNVTLTVERPRAAAVNDAHEALTPPITPVRRKIKRGWLLWIAPLLVSPFMYLSVEALSRTEDALAIQVHRSRVVTYSLEPRGPLTFPIEPNTDVIRFVARAFSRGELPLAPHSARISFEIRGAARTRTEVVEVPLSALVQHAVPEDLELSVGDASPINIDVHGSGAGELTLTLQEVGDADGLLVRAFGRDAGDGALWRKLAPVSGEARTLALARTEPPPTQPARGSLGTFDVSGDERVTGIARGPNTIVARAANSNDAVVTMVLRSGLHGAQTIAGVGQVVADLAANEQAEFEVASAGDEPIALDAADGGGVTLGRSLRYFRAAADRPVRVDVGAEPLVLQVHARRPVSRASGEPVEIALESTVTNARRSTSELLSATRARSRFDRYEDASDELAPTEAAAFRLLVPARTRLALSPREGELDLSLSELDPRAPAQSQADRAARKVGFETRWPSNVADFDAKTGLVHVGPKLMLGVEPSAPTLGMAYVMRPRRALAMQREGKWFVRADRPIELRVSGKQPLVLPVRVFAERAGSREVSIELDGGTPRRRALGSVQRITTNRSVTVDGVAKTYVILGDDLVAGRHTIAFTSDADTALWVQLPWLPPNTPRWVSGSFGQ